LISKINYINPLSHFIALGRNMVVYNQIPTVFSIIGIMVISLVTFIIGLYIFNKAKLGFAEKI